MPSFFLLLAYFVVSSNYLHPVGSINLETDSAVSDDRAADLPAALFDPVSPVHQGDDFLNANPENQGTLFDNPDGNLAILESNPIASDRLQPLLNNLNVPSTASDNGFVVPDDDKGNHLVSSRIDSIAPESVATVPETRGPLLDDLLVIPSGPEAGTTISEGRIASTLAGEQNDGDSSDSLPCGSKNHGQQVRRRQLSCPLYYQFDKAPRRTKPEQNRPENLVEPKQDPEHEAVEYGEPNPWIHGFDDDPKRCSNTKRTLCCDGPSKLTQWVSNCILWNPAEESCYMYRSLKVYCCRGFDTSFQTWHNFRMRPGRGLGRGECKLLFAV